MEQQAVLQGPSFTKQGRLNLYSLELDPHPQRPKFGQIGALYQFESITSVFFKNRGITRIAPMKNVKGLSFGLKALSDR